MCRVVAQGCQKETVWSKTLFETNKAEGSKKDDADEGDDEGEESEEEVVDEEEEEEEEPSEDKDDEEEGEEEQTLKKKPATKTAKTATKNKDVVYTISFNTDLRQAIRTGGIIFFTLRAPRRPTMLVTQK